VAEIDWTRARENPGELAAWMLELIDESPDKLAILEVPIAWADDLNGVEAVFIREFDRAKLERPDLGVKLTAGGAERPDVALLIAVHEHQWVGGMCVHGCRDERTVQ
jgi:hypothetical protein